MAGLSALPSREAGPVLAPGPERRRPDAAVSGAPVAATGLTGLVGSRVAQLVPGWHALRCDVQDAEAVRRAVAQSPGAVVVHFAAFTDTNAAWAQRGDRDGACYRVNVLGSRHVAAACRDAGKYLVHVSTDYVFDGTKEALYTEDDAPRPLDWYGWTKYWAEQEVGQSGAAHLIARISFPYRAGYGRRQDVVRKILASLRAGRELRMFTDTLITPTFTDQLARAFDRITAERPRGVLHLAGAQALSPYELARATARTFGLDQSLITPATLASYASPDARPYARHLNVSSARAQEVLGGPFRSVTSSLAALHAQWASAAAGMADT
ncbi:SDR family oxidoreductase [Streptomyces sp. CA2R101]|uniref:SDR family oxidoreductase n=1 Tax=Streptomyces sp. CA2R101 TaxID=3120152 RepID=UPI00300B2975